MKEEKREREREGKGVGSHTEDAGMCREDAQRRPANVRVARMGIRPCDGGRRQFGLCTVAAM